jgi:hypothetical protein
MLNAADSGMYASKRAGRGGTSFALGSRWAAQAGGTACRLCRLRGVNPDSTSRWWVLLTFGTLIVLLFLVIHISQ